MMKSWKRARERERKKMYAIVNVTWEAMYVSSVLGQAKTTIIEKNDWFMLLVSRHLRLRPVFLSACYFHCETSALGR